jgi:hypothetical protein
MDKGIRGVDGIRESDGLTFVTAYLDIGSDRIFDWRLEHFMKIVDSGVQICVFSDAGSVDRIKNVVNGRKNVTIMQPLIEISCTWVYGICERYLKACPTHGPSLPATRNAKKDTYEYLVLQNSKTEFMRLVVQENPFSSSHFAWIDFSMAYLFQDAVRFQNQLRFISKCNLAPNFLAIPGRWDAMKPADVDRYLDEIHWRFCGGFFIGDRDSVLEFCDSVHQIFPFFTKNYRRLTWEVNFWAFLETIGGWTPVWYKADHNDSILNNIPYACLTRPLLGTAGFTKGNPVIRYPVIRYPVIPGFQPGSASYVNHDGKHWLNTRYTNYHLTDTGRYLFPDGSKVIRNINVRSSLDKDLNPEDFQEVDETGVGIPVFEGACSTGLEDMRLFSDSGTLRFIATTLGYSGNGKARMVVGDYSNNGVSNCEVIEPPTDTKCEKNWIPLSNNYYVYQWSPFQIGRVEKGKLRIVKTHDIRVPIFDKVRGSTIFQETLVLSECTDKACLGVVHFSEEGSPRRYFHMLVLLEVSEGTWTPKKCSAPFYFANVGIEFCIGFLNTDHHYTFWISQMDRDPAVIKVDREAIKLDIDIARL